VRYLFILFAAILFYACPNCENEVVDWGPIPDSVKAFIPYQDGEIYSLKYSDSLIINFEAERWSVEDWAYGRGSWCPTDIRFEKEMVRLKPDYPLYDIEISIANFDSSQYHYYVYLRSQSFGLPVNPLDFDYYEMMDSLVIDSIIYTDVFVSYSSAYIDHQWADKDTLYYNNDFGILKLLFSNGESYTIH
jgi:hypothetical protein